MTVPLDPSNRRATAAPRHLLDRRRLLGWAASGTLVAAPGLAPRPAAAATRAIAAVGAGGGAAPGAAASPPATWRTWVLAAPDELRPPPRPRPPGPRSTNCSTSKPPAPTRRSRPIRQWTARPAVLIWTELANAALDEFNSPRSASTGPTPCCRPRCTTPSSPPTTPRTPTRPRRRPRSTTGSRRSMAMPRTARRSRRSTPRSPAPRRPS